MFTGAGVGGSSGGTVGEGEESGEVRVEEEEIMEGEERRGEEDAWLDGLPPPMFDLLLWKENLIVEIFNRYKVSQYCFLEPDLEVFADTWSRRRGAELNRNG